MIGFLIGTACLLALLRVLRGGRGWRRGRCGSGGCGDGYGGRGFAEDRGWDDAAPWERGFRERDGGASEGPYREGPGTREAARGEGSDEESFGGLRGKALLWEAFRRLDTTPGQEKALRAVMGELREKRGAIRDELGKARKDAAQAMRGEQWDENALGEAVSRLDASMDLTRKAVIEALAKTHEVLDERQRKILADLIEDGRLPFFSRGEGRGGGFGRRGRGRHGRGW